MSIFARRPWTRWAVPASALALVAAGAVVASSSATADATLPERTPAQLLVDVQGAKVTGLSGTVVQTSDLGLPSISLPGATKGSADLTSTITGTHTWRVWYAGDAKMRVALLGQGSESNIIRNGKDVWVWSSTTKSATHYTVPEHIGPKKDANSLTAPRVAEGLATPLPSSPQEAAEKALALLDPTTEVTSPGTTTVAGRAAYQLVLTPRAKESLVASVRIAVDAETKVPLRVQVMSTRIPTPAFEVGFSAVDFGMPDAHVFTFTPPPGTTVDEGGMPSDAVTSSGVADAAPADKGANPMIPGEQARPGVPDPSQRPQSPVGAHAKPTISGSGWATVVVSRMPADVGAMSGDSSGSMPGSEPGSAPGSAPKTGAGPGSGSGVFGMLQAAMTPISGSWGTGRVLEGTLFTAIITDDGRVAVGAVGADTLQTALAAAPKQ